MIGWRISLWAVIVLIAIWFLWMVRGILAPFILALLVSAILQPTIKKLRLRGYSRGWAIALVFAAFLGVISVAGILLVPLASNQVNTLRIKLDEVTASLSAPPSANGVNHEANTKIDDFLKEAAPTLERFGLPTTRKEIVEQYVEPYQKDLTSAGKTFFSGFLGFLTGFASKFLLLLFTPVFVLLILLDADRMKRRFAGMIPPSIRAETLELLGDVGEVFFNYLRGVSVVVMYYIGIASVILTLLGAPYSILLALLFSLLYLIPYVGQVANAIILFGITVAMGKTGGLLFGMATPMSYALTITAIFFVCMTIFDQLFYARLVGQSVGLHPLVSFFVVFSGGALFGATGMLLAFPVAGSLKVILDRLINFTSKTQDDLKLPVIPLRHRAS
ncbi:MAG TPA: AI-2E family transporter [Fimbriimonadaceae bacterium]|nr:AI-2E family transporter [Fimbriimonadaceae bacterium]